MDIVILVFFLIENPDLALLSSTNVFETEAYIFPDDKKDTTGIVPLLLNVKFKKMLILKKNISFIVI